LENIATNNSVQANRLSP